METNNSYENIPPGAQEEREDTVKPENKIENPEAEKVVITLKKGREQSTSNLKEVLGRFRNPVVKKALVGALATVITFSSLTAFAGENNYSRIEYQPRTPTTIEEVQEQTLTNYIMGGLYEEINKRRSFDSGTEPVSFAATIGFKSLPIAQNLGIEIPDPTNFKFAVGLKGRFGGSEENSFKKLPGKIKQAFTDFTQEVENTDWTSTLFKMATGGGNTISFGDQEAIPDYVNDNI